MDNKKTLVQDMLEGYVKAFPRRVRLLGNHILLRAKEKDLSKTAVIIGNGSGHEPAMIDLVGRDFLMPMYVEKFLRHPHQWK